MALFVQKPIFWNTRQYTAPSGAPGTGGYPKEHGYGQEEWNNAARMIVTRDGLRYRVFHTGALGAAPLERHAGRTFIFMTASHNGIQQLVGVAGNATSLLHEPQRAQRDAIVKELSLHELWKEAWSVPRVRRNYRNDPRLFLKRWRNDLNRLPSWICPEELFWWFDEPVTLDPWAITGKRRLLGMFSSYTELDATMLERLLDAIPVAQRKEQWERLNHAIQRALTEAALAEEAAEGSAVFLPGTLNLRARRGQNKFRENLMRIWGNACAVTGVACREVLRASHVKPWSESTPRQRIDGHNGLLLSANLDALFDRGLITFDEYGQMQISARLDAVHRQALGLPRPLRFLPKEMLDYLRYHQQHVFRH